MTRTNTRISFGLGSLAIAFVAGVAVDSYLRVYGPPMPRLAIAQDVDHALKPPGGGNASSIAPAPAPARRAEPASAVATTGITHRLRVPVEGIDAEALKGGFAEARTGHAHEAVDMLAPRNTPVHAVQDGTIAKLFVSKQGGNTIYEIDEAGRLEYYYAHLERYATGLKEGDRVSQGQVIGYVGTSGNAPPNTPHLHFAVFELGPERQWWKGKAIDPYPLFR